MLALWLVYEFARRFASGATVGHENPCILSGGAVFAMRKRGRRSSCYTATYREQQRSAVCLVADDGPMTDPGRR